MERIQIMDIKIYSNSKIKEIIKDIVIIPKIIQNHFELYNLSLQFLNS